MALLYGFMWLLDVCSVVGISPSASYYADSTDARSFRLVEETETISEGLRNHRILKIISNFYSLQSFRM
jgi:hypothetical protein